MKSSAKHPIDQSSLYRLPSKRRMADLLGFDLAEFELLIAESSYRVFQNAKGRWIQHPVGRLEAVHARLQALLKRIALPDYVHSQKGRSYVSNAVVHASAHPFVKTDISKFYPSTSCSAVIALFKDTFKCPPDVAWYLAKLCCYKGTHLPTGSPISGSIAFHAHRAMFEEIAELAREHGCTFTLYVDDLGISGFAASKALLFRVRGIIRRHGLNTKSEKSRTYGMGRAKRITGVVVTEKGPRVPNGRRHKIHQLRQEVQRTQAGAKRDVLERKLAGSLQEAAQIEHAARAFDAQGEPS